MQYYILLALIAMIGFGIVAIIYKLASPHIDSVALVMIYNLIGAILAGAYWFLFHSPKKITTTGFYYTSIAAILGTVAFITYVIAIKFGKVSVVAPIRNLSLAVAVVIALAFLAEKITLVKIIGIVFAVIAVVLLSL